MPNLVDYPFLLLVTCLAFFWVSAWIGERLAEVRGKAREVDHDDFVFVLGGTLTLLGLIIGFTFSMAVSRYDQRKNYEEEEANAIGTEYARANLLPPGDASNIKVLLRAYLNERIVHYRTHNPQQLQQADDRIAGLQREMWSAVSIAVAANPTPLTALVASGMNDVLNSQGYAQASHWNRIPVAAWILLISISLFCNALIGYGARGRSALLLLILPLALSISLFLIADIDSPRRGIIHVEPQNLESLAASFRSH
jgi:hypothetical protein